MKFIKHFAEKILVRRVITKTRVLLSLPTASELSSRFLLYRVMPPFATLPYLFQFLIGGESL